MSVQDEHGYWDSMSEQERNLSSLYPLRTKQDKNMSVEEIDGHFCQNYIPEIWQVCKDTIYAAIAAVEDGLEFAHEVLVAHDTNLGRDMKKNKVWAETIEASIRQMELTLKLLKDCPEKLNE